MRSMGAIDKRSQETTLMPMTGQTIRVKGVSMGHEGRQEKIKSSEEGWSPSAIARTDLAKTSF